MTYVMTYDSLITSVLRWLDREDDEDLIAELPRMIDTAERKVARAIKTLLSIKFATSSFIIGTNIYQKPARWLETVSLSYEVGSNNVVMFERSYEYVISIYPDFTDTDAPQFFVDYEYNQFMVFPTPDVAYNFLYAYYERPEPLGTDQQTNFLTTIAPDLLLYATLLETAPFLRADERVPVWQQAYREKLSELVVEDIGRAETRAQNVIEERKA